LLDKIIDYKKYNQWQYILRICFSKNNRGI
jgi:hypothetical protein